MRAEINPLRLYRLIFAAAEENFDRFEDDGGQFLVVVVVVVVVVVYRVCTCLRCYPQNTFCVMDCKRALLKS